MTLPWHRTLARFLIRSQPPPREWLTLDKLRRAKTILDERAVVLVPAMAEDLREGWDSHDLDTFDNFDQVWEWLVHCEEVTGDPWCAPPPIPGRLGLVEGFDWIEGKALPSDYPEITRYPDCYPEITPQNRVTRAWLRFRRRVMRLGNSG